MLYTIIIIILSIAADQITKYFAVANLAGQPSYPFIEDILHFTYVENRGAAFGMLQNQKIFFVFVAAIFLCVIVYVLIKVPTDKKFNSLHIFLTMIAAGAIGNMIDRLRFDYVVDFIYIVLINFPIFNVADIYVTVSTFFFIIQILFVYEENDFNFLSFKQKKFRELK